MARVRRKVFSPPRRVGRAAIVSANRRLLDSYYLNDYQPSNAHYYYDNTPLTYAEDLRQYHPDHRRVGALARTVFGSPARVRAPRSLPRRIQHTAPSRTPRFHVPSVVAFAAPRSVSVCVRRARRRQIIHAMGIAGTKVRPPRRTVFSSISCRG